MKDTISIVWGIEDVLQQAENDRYKLTKKHAREILAELKEGHDATIGINWDVISCVLSDYAHKNNLERD